MKSGRQNSGDSTNSTSGMDSGRQNSGDSTTSTFVFPNPNEEHRGAPYPEDEQQRIKFLKRLNVLDTIGENAFDVITKLLTDIYRVPIALVSLVDSSRQWFKSVVGLDVKETSRELSFCAHLLLPEESGILLVPDATLDPRFKNSALVKGEPFIRFYCGAPIVLGGVRLGSLCIIDREPRQHIGNKDAMFLANFADIVAGLIDKERKQSSQYEMIDNPSFLIDVSAEQWPIWYSNRLGKELLDEKDLLDEKAGATPSFFNYFSFDDEVPSTAMANETRTQEGLFGDRPCFCTFHPASSHGFGKDTYSHVMFPYAEPSASSSQPDGQSSSSNASSPGVRQYNFVVVKWATEKEDVSVGPSKSNSGVLTLLHQIPCTLITSPDELDAALGEELSIVLLTSQFCAACVHFLEFYGMVCRHTPDVQFCAVNVDETPDIARKIASGAVFLPSVIFYTQGIQKDQLQGSHCALFRQKLRVLLSRSAASPLGEADCVSSKSEGGSADESPLQTEECLEDKCSLLDLTDVNRRNNSLYADVSQRLEAERAHSRSLEALLAGLTATRLKELRENHEASLAQLALLKRDLSTRRRSKDVWSSSRAARICEDAELSDEPGEAEGGKYAQELPSYRFHGTVAKVLKPVLANAKVLLYGGPRADSLESGMRQAKIDVCRQPRISQGDPIPTHGRRGRPLAIVDVTDFRSNEATWEWFEQVSDALSLGGLFVVISSNFEWLEVLGMLAEAYGWGITCTQGSRRDYGIMILEKGPESDQMIQNWRVESFDNRT